jgi:glycosyltransferase involved in cell wall biosynthesis
MDTKTSQPRVSIVIPTFNRAEMLKTAIDSTLAQTVPCEVIVVNHGSTDHTDETVAAYGDRVQYIKRDKDLGPHFCWLEGVLNAKGEFIHLQFDDDWIEPTFIEKCLSVMSPEVGFAFTRADVFDDIEGEVKETHFANWQTSSGIFKSKVMKLRILNSMISPAAALYRKQVLVDALFQGSLPFSTRHYHGVGPDCYVTLLSMLRYKSIGYINEPLAVFRAHAGSITVDAERNKAKQKRIKAAYFDVKMFYLELKFLKFAQKIMSFGR